MPKYKCLKHKELYEQGERCPKCLSEKRRKYEEKKRDKERARFYQSKDWRIVRQKVIDYYAGVDIWFLGMTGKLKPCLNLTVHHIFEYSKHPSLALAVTNLIPVSAQSHNEIHIYYDSGRFEEAIEIINTGKKRFEGLRNHGY
jgi:5-methylcytosine-specific restriction endonuclease McrA